MRPHLAKVLGTEGLIDMEKLEKPPVDTYQRLHYILCRTICTYILKISTRDRILKTLITLRSLTANILCIAPQTYPELPNHNAVHAHVDEIS
jgi:hypothetical protein